MNFYFLYYLLNTKTNKGYIGYTNDLNRRLYDHVKALNEGVHPNEKLQEDYDKDHFEVIILETHLNKDNSFIANREKELIAKYNTFNNGYNKTEGGERQGDERVFSQDNIFKAYALLSFYPNISTAIIQNIFQMSESSVLRLKSKQTHISTIKIFDSMTPEKKSFLKQALDIEYDMEERIKKHNETVTFKARKLDRETVLMIIAVGKNRAKKGAHMERQLGLASSHASRIIRGIRYKEFHDEYMNMSSEDKSFWLQKGLNFFQLD